MEKIGDNSQEIVLTRNYKDLNACKEHLSNVEFPRKASRNTVLEVTVSLSRQQITVPTLFDVEYTYYNTRKDEKSDMFQARGVVSFYAKQECRTHFKEVPRPW